MYYFAEGFMQEGLPDFGLLWREAKADTLDEVRKEAESHRVWAHTLIYIGERKAGLIWPI